MSILASFLNVRRVLCESLGVGCYSYRALNDLDRKLERHLDFDNGVFVEAGANDGVQQSNTYYFEKIRGWTGILIEPDPGLAAACRKNRRVMVAEAALVGPDFQRPVVDLFFAGLMSTIEGAMGDAEATARHVARGLAVQKLSGSRRVSVPARTLSSVLDEFDLRRPVDLLSLDVEGGEIGALRGIDFSRHAPRHICVEARDPVAIRELLEPRYRLLEVLMDMGTHRDLLYALR